MEQEMGDKYLYRRKMKYRGNENTIENNHKKYNREKRNNANFGNIV